MEEGLRHLTERLHGHLEQVRAGRVAEPGHERGARASVHPDLKNLFLSHYRAAVLLAGE